MDFDRLYQLLPKPSVTWNIDEIQLWLEFIGLSAFAPQFRAASVDGSCLAELSEDDIHHELNITSKIITKKIMTWIKQGIQGYDNYLACKDRTLKETSLPRHLLRSEMQSREPIFQKCERTNNLKKWEERLDFREGSAERRGKRRETAELENERREVNELVIKQCELSIKQGGMIGRHAKNEIHIADENVSRFHAHIEYDQGVYFIRDCGSSSGTFIRISEKTQLQHDQIIEMGSNQFLIDMTCMKNLVIKVVEGPNMGENSVHPASKIKFSVGRKTNNGISFPQDQHLSNIHATVFVIEGVWYIEDLGTTNGTWIRLSPEGVKSERHALESGAQFKLGSSLTYECQLNESNRKTEKEKSDKCQFCRIAERDCLFLPCKHNISCQRCSQLNELSHCVSCGSEITEVMKIYKV